MKTVSSLEIFYNGVGEVHVEASVITNIGFQTEGGDFLMFNIGGWTSSAAHIYMVHMLCYQLLEQPHA
jgi:hypothetical protein